MSDKSKNQEVTRDISSIGLLSAQFELERTYPETADLFAPYDVIFDNSTLVVVDTNALLLPYTMGKDNLTALSDAYNRLARNNQIFVPERVVREFIRHRDRKLADLVQGLNNRKSQMPIADPKLSPLLEGVDGYDDLQKLAEEFNARHRAYRDQLDKLIAMIRGWRGNDPVTKLYHEIFNEARSIKLVDSSEDLGKEWDRRRALKLPPGYADADKLDTGIGDFLIWKSLLQLGAQQKRDMIFVSHDRKPDWFLQSGNEGIYPRPELVDEYRRASGCNIMLSTLHEFLQLSGAPKEVIAEVQQAEESAQSVDWVQRAIPLMMEPRSSAAKYASFRTHKQRLNSIYETWGKRGSSWGPRHSCQLTIQNLDTMQELSVGDATFHFSADVINDGELFLTVHPPSVGGGKIPEELSGVEIPETFIQEMLSWRAVVMEGESFLMVGSSGHKLVARLTFARKPPMAWATSIAVTFDYELLGATAQVTAPS